MYLKPGNFSDHRRIVFVTGHLLLIFQIVNVDFIRYHHIPYLKSTKCRNMKLLKFLILAIFFNPGNFSDPRRIVFVTGYLLLIFQIVNVDFIPYLKSTKCLNMKLLKFLILAIFFNIICPFTTKTH
jgi:hypothetical protein